MVKDGKPRKVSRQPLTDQHIYSLLVEVAPSESADHIDKMAETEFEYVADRGLGLAREHPSDTVEQRRSPAARFPEHQHRLRVANCSQDLLCLGGPIHEPALVRAGWR